MITIVGEETEGSSLGDRRVIAGSVWEHGVGKLGVVRGWRAWARCLQDSPERVHEEYGSEAAVCGCGGPARSRHARPGRGRVARGRGFGRRGAGGGAVPGRGRAAGPPALQGAL